MQIGKIIEDNQPKEFSKLTPKKRRKRKESNSFNFFDRIMRERTDVDTSKCGGRW